MKFKVGQLWQTRDQLSNYEVKEIDADLSFPVVTSWVGGERIPGVGKQFFDSTGYFESSEYPHDKDLTTLISESSKLTVEEELALNKAAEIGIVGHTQPTRPEMRFQYTPPDPAVEHPPHYNKGIECWDYITSHNMGFLAGNIIKYVTRYQHKNGTVDLLKAQEYLCKLIEKETK